jgi:endonuclease/exonuclease/phosphatase family metal-dependent hydrolase
VRALSWNVFHGRDHAPDRSLHTWRSRLTRHTERNPTHAQVNRELLAEFSSVLAEAEWDVALLQECPPRWAEALATACRAEAHLLPTSRNLPGPLAHVQAAAAKWNPDLLGAWEGGSNLTLARGRAGTPIIRERRELTLTRRPETRKMAFTVLRDGLCVANLHASVPKPAARAEVRTAAAAAVDWARGAPLVFGGDLNLRPASNAEVFEDLERTYGLAPPTAPGSLDHLLARDLEVVSPPAAWPAERREVPDPAQPTIRIRLSDHAPVAAAFNFTP